MANTDDTQANMANNNKDVQKCFVEKTTNVSKNNESKACLNTQVDAPLMRYFDLTEEANYSYVLGYN